MQRLTVQEVAKQLGVSVPTVRRWASEGRIRAEKVGRQWLFAPGDVPQRRLRNVARASASSLDFATALGQLKKVDLVREVWIPDVLRFADQLLASDDLVRAAANRIAGVELFDVAVEVEIPKGFFFSRSGLLLTLPDRIAYHAVVKEMASQIEAQRISGHVFSCQLAGRPDYLLQNGVQLWLDWRKAVNGAIDPDSSLVVETDITAYFDNIQHRLLFADIDQLAPTPSLGKALRAMLRAWMPVPDVGIPQGPDASRLLGNLYLYPIDQVMTRGAWSYFRYMDDIRIVAPTQAVAIDAVRTLDRECRKRALSLSAQKTKMMSGKEALKKLGIEPQFAAITYLVDSGIDGLARRESRRLLRQALGKGPGLADPRAARFSLGRLQRLFERKDRQTVALVLGRLEDLGPVIKLVAQYLVPFIDRKSVRDGLAQFINDPARNFSPYVSSWIMALMLEAADPLPFEWTNYARDVVRDRNQALYLRTLAANLVGRSHSPGDVGWLQRQVHAEFDPSLVRAYMVALARVGRLDANTVQTATMRFPQLKGTASYLRGRTGLPSLVYADRVVPISRRAK